MKTELKILYLKDPTSVENQEDVVLEKYIVRAVHEEEELLPSLSGFVPHILLCSLGSDISPQKVLDLLNLPHRSAPVIISVANNNLKNVLPLLEASSNLHSEKESSKPNVEDRREMEERHRFVYDCSLDAILLTQSNGTILAANPAATTMLEMTEEEICKAGRAGIVDPTDIRLSYAIAEREKNGRFHSELTLIKKSGVKFPVDITSSTYKDSKGDLLNTIIFRDITERKLIEEEVRISHQAYKTLFYHSPIPHWIYDHATLQIVEVNEVALEKYGYTRKEFLNLNIKDLRPEEEIPHLLKYLSDLDGARRNIRQGIFTHVKKDGRQIKVEVYGYKLRYGNRNCRLVTSIDITEKEEAAGRLELKQARLDAAQGLAKVGYWEHNISTQTYFLSEMFCRIWERDTCSLGPSGLIFEETIHPQDRDKFLQSQKDSIHKGKEHNVEYRILLPLGKIKWIHERGRVLTWKDGVPETVERIVQDVTEERVYLQKLATSESRYKGIVQSQTNYLIRTDMEGNYSYYNDKFFTDFGWLYENQNIIGSPSISSIMGYHHQAVIDLVKRCVMVPGTAFQIEIDKPGKNVGVRSTLWEFTCLVDSDGNPTEIQCVGIDISDRVRAERKLKDSEMRYQLITEATSDAIWDWDLNTGNLIMGNSFFSMFGHDPNDITTLSAWENLIHPEDVLRIKGELNTALKGSGKIWYCEYRLKKKNGKYANVIENGAFLRNENNKAYRQVGALQDITENKKLEDLLNIANTLSRIGSYEVDMVTGELYWSNMTKEIHEVGKDFIPDGDKGISFYKEGKSRYKIYVAFSKAVNENLPFDEELEIITAGGRNLWVRVMGRPESENGKCLRITGSFQDIDKLKRAEVEILNAVKEKDTLLQSIGDAFFAVDERWTVTYWNNQAAKLLNCPKKAILNKNIWEVFSDAIGTTFHHNYEATMRDGKKRHFEAYFEKNSAWYDVAVYPAREGLSVFFNEITQRKTAELRLNELNVKLTTYTRELVKANKGLEQFSYIVSHNLRSPVANLLGLADLLQDDNYPANVKQKLLAEVFSNVERLDSVVKDLNSILQVKGDIKAKKEKINLTELVSGINSSIQNLIGEERAEIICDFAETTIITSVRSYLYSIFYNLILNSIKYKRPDVPPKLVIRFGITEESHLISFEDNGLGIDLSKNKGEIFNLYKRFHHHVEGKGMGLFMVKTQVEMLGGKINVQSEVDKGTTFSIKFKRNTSK